MMGITAAGTLLPETPSVIVNALLLTVVFGVVNLPCISTWVIAGTGIRRLLTDDRSRRIVKRRLGLTAGRDRLRHQPLNRINT